MINSFMRLIEIIMLSIRNSCKKDYYIFLIYKKRESVDISFEEKDLWRWFMKDGSVHYLGRLDKSLSALYNVHTVKK